MTSQPSYIFVFSGKRKSGKDFFADKLQQKLGVNVCSIMRLSAPLKEEYAKEHQLNYSQLLDSSSYKEKYRCDMIKWGEKKRQNNPSYFCELVCSGPGKECAIWIISDARRKTDISYFKKVYGQKVVTVRINASEETRKSRGYEFTKGVDDVASECDLDFGVNFDVLIENNGDADSLERNLNVLCRKISDF